MTDAWRRWPPPAPAFMGSQYWGEAHLALDAIVAYVDDELAPAARGRATSHLMRCLACSGEVVAQYQARSALRAGLTPTAPSSLLHSLRAIPQETQLPGPPAGLAVDQDGQLVAMLRELPSSPAELTPAQSARRTATGRRRRLGAGVMVSSLALGALVVGATPAPTAVPQPGAGPGAARSAVDAQLRIDPVSGTSVSPSVKPSGAPAPPAGPSRR